VTIEGSRIDRMRDAELTRFRLNHIGFVFQRFYLMPALTAIENVELPMAEARVARDARLARARELLAYVRLGGRRDHRPAQLSGGEQQRVAIARALVQHARIILADEPIASLDPESARNVMEILTRVNRERGITVFVSLHQVQFARRYCPRTIALRLGEVVYDGPSVDLTAPLLRTLYGTAVDELLDGTEALDAMVNDPVLAATMA